MKTRQPSVLENAVAEVINHGPSENPHVPEETRDIISRCRLRLAGWSFPERSVNTEYKNQYEGAHSECKEVAYDDEIERYMWLERRMVLWLDILLEELKNVTEEDIKEARLTEDQLLLCHYFRLCGGHASRYSAEQVRDILRHGIIYFLELEVRDGIYTTIGSIAGLSQAPFKTKEHMPQSVDELNKDWPGFDINDIGGIPVDWRRPLFNTSRSDFILCRTSVIEELNEHTIEPTALEQLGGKIPPKFENLDLRRRSMGSALKYALFSTALSVGARSNVFHSHAIFNIGSLYLHNSSEDFTEGINTSSHLHNSQWAEQVCWRYNYCNKYIENILTMYWQMYRGDMVAFVKKLASNNGTLAKKGWPIADIRRMTKLNAHHLLSDIASNRKEFWGYYPPQP